MSVLHVISLTLPLENTYVKYLKSTVNIFLSVSEFKALDAGIWFLSVLYQIDNDEPQSKTISFKMENKVIFACTKV